MKITSGLMSNMVLQRNRHNVCNISFSGLAESDGIIQARIKNLSITKTVILRKRVGRVCNGVISGILSGLPAGGYYDIELLLVDQLGRIADRTSFSNIVVGDVWLFEGLFAQQASVSPEGASIIDPGIRIYGRNGQWSLANYSPSQLAATNRHNSIAGRHTVSPCPNTDSVTVTGIAFAQAMKECTGVPQGLMAAANDETTLSQWISDIANRDESDRYTAMKRRVAINGGLLAGLVWHQIVGECSDVAAAQYTTFIKELLKALRRDCRNEQLPVVIVQLARIIGKDTPSEHCWNDIQNQQRRLPHLLPHVAVIPSIDLRLEDGIRIKGSDQLRLGRRLAYAMRCLQSYRRHNKPPMEIESIKVQERRGVGDVVLSFCNVSGNLRAGIRPNGFSLFPPSSATSMICDAELKKHTVVLRTTLPPALVRQSTISYGIGLNPACNVIDMSDRSIPVFGPLPVVTQQESVRATGFARYIRVSKVFPVHGNLSRLPYPKDSSRLCFQPRLFDGDFCNLHSELRLHARQNMVVYLACAVHCPTSMRLRIHLGYDGPVKLWRNSNAVFVDNKGSNPATMWDATIPWRAQQGNHELLVALGSNRGKAWGVFLHLERIAVPEQEIKLGRDYLAMPLFLG